MIYGIWQSVIILLFYVLFDWSFFFSAFGKKIDALAKEKDCELVGEWKKSLMNHLYWSAVSTPDGNENLIEAKWISG